MHIRASEQYPELLPSKSTAQVRLTERRLDLPHHGLQHLIARCVAVGIVDLFEVVNVQQQRTQRDSVAPGIGEHGVGLFIESATVVHSRQIVRTGCVAGDAVLDLQLMVQPQK